MTKLRILRFLVGCVLFFAVWEICARVDDHVREGASLFGNYGISNMLTADGAGVVGKPYGHFGKWQLNALGFRGPDLHPGRRRVICVGASETFGMGESQGMEYPRQLEKVLNHRLHNSDVEVVNTAYAGQSLRTFAQRTDKIVDTVSPTVATIYPSFLTYLSADSLGKPDYTGWVKEPHGFHSRIVDKLLNSIDRLPPWAANLRYRYHIWHALRKGEAVVSALPEFHVEQFRQDLRAVIDSLQQRNVKVVLVTHATFFGREVDPEERDMLIAWRRFVPTLADEGWLDIERRMNAVIRQEAQARHLPLVDAAASLEGSQNFADWVHFTNKGAGIMARLIADKVVPELGKKKKDQPRASQNVTLCCSAGRPWVPYSAAESGD